jgi:hypothetical protein
VAGRSEPELEAWLKSELILKTVARLAEHGLVRAAAPPCRLLGQTSA